MRTRNTALAFLRKLFMSILAVGTLLTVAPAFADTTVAPITGTIDFGGTVTFDTTSLATATRVNIWNTSFVLQSSGDFSSIAPGTNVTMAAPWIFNPSTPTNSLWSVGGFTFDLNASVIVQQTSNFLNVTGTGVISGNGFSPTPGTWSFTASDSNGSNRTTFGFQTDSAAVPEPTSMTLLGMGAITVAFLLRRNRNLI
jgi:hypothetical protein